MAKIAKDTAAAAVLFASLIAVLLGIVVFLPYLLQWLSDFNLNP
ncbi:MAG: diacylglycerol kinase [Bellilinea sp.]